MLGQEEINKMVFTRARVGCNTLILPRYCTVLKKTESRSRCKDVGRRAEICTVGCFNVLDKTGGRARVKVM